MPCTYFETEEEKAQPFVKLREELNETTRMLCEVMCHADPSLTLKVKGLDKWWTKHREMDRRREAAEKAEREHKIKQLEAELASLKGEA